MLLHFLISINITLCLNVKCVLLKKIFQNTNIEKTRADPDIEIVVRWEIFIYLNKVIRQIELNHLTVRIFTVFGQFIRGENVTQRSIGCKAPRDPPHYPGPKKVEFSRRDISSLAVKGLEKVSSSIPAWGFSWWKLLLTANSNKQDQ